MSRKINWDSGLLENIELIYEKAEADNDTGKLLERLEEKALSECRAICAAGSYKTQSGKHITPQQFESLPDSEKESMIVQLGRLGIGELQGTDYSSATITVRFSKLIQRTMACTFFVLMDYLEACDGAVDILLPKWTLEIQAPLGGKKGLMQWEMMIALFYPWISVREVSTEEEAVPPYPDVFTQNAGNAEPKNAPKQENARPTEPESPYSAFYAKMKGKNDFRMGFAHAQDELANAISGKKFSIKHNGQPMSVEYWRSLPDMTKLEYVIAMGNYSITDSALICVDFCEIFPWAIAITLLYRADNEKKAQAIDAGDNSNITCFVEALTSLHDCTDSWSCTIFSPDMVTIDSKAPAIRISSEAKPQPKKPAEKTQPVQSNEAPKEKKSFWKRLFG